MSYENDSSCESKQCEHGKPSGDLKETARLRNMVMAQQKEIDMLIKQLNAFEQNNTMFQTVLQITPIESASKTRETQRREPSYEPPKVNLRKSIEVSPKTKSKNEEIELKYVIEDKYHDIIPKIAIKRFERIQAYIEITGNNQNFQQIRIHKRSDKPYGVITIKTRRKGEARTEYQYLIDSDEAKELISLCPYRMEKERFLVKHDDLLYTVDFFGGDNKGLVLAEIEAKDRQSLDYIRRQPLPYWIEQKNEVTYDERYYCHNLARVPYTKFYQHNFLYKLSKFFTFNK